MQSIFKNIILLFTDEALKLHLDTSTDTDDKVDNEDANVKAKPEVVKLKDDENYVDENKPGCSNQKKGFRDYIQIENGGMIFDRM